jgi:prolyl oligopeptidase
MEILPTALMLVALMMTSAPAARAEDHSPSASSDSPSASAADPYLWLEEVTGAQPLAWVREQNSLTSHELESSADFEPIRQQVLAILDSKERIPFVSKHGRNYYNFWRDARHVRGLWRRTTLDEYKKAEPEWETVIDTDQLAETDKENWVWKGYDVLYPSYDRCLVFLSRGGADAKVVREFDLNSKRFLDEGFYLPEAKSEVAWRDRNSLYVGTDFGPGSLTSSGYPRIVKLWKRGTPLKDAEVVFEGKTEDVSVTAAVDHDHGRTYEFIRREMTFFTDEEHLRRGEKWIKIDKPADATVGTFEDQLLLKLRSDWKVDGRTYPAGALLSADLGAYLEGARKFEVLFEPTARKCLAGSSETKRYIIIHELDNVQNHCFALKRENGKWVRTLLDTPALGSISATGIDPDESDDYFLSTSDFLTPASLWLGTVGHDKPERLKQLPGFFNSEGLETRQFEATSKDGTKVPYFLVSRRNLETNGHNPTLLYGYGGFEISMLPSYSGSIGAAWLERGGVYVLADIRGGGEFGPTWHEAARKAHRQRAYDDFAAVAEDLIARKITSPRHLGIQGGSNGGLLMGVMLTERPDLFHAVVCQVPLLDMQRFNHLLAGASWMDEYGDPDRPEDWAYIRKYSPYQNVFKGVNYPRVLFMTSTRDDRVHPGHARKMVARMKEQGHDVLYYENTEGGHGAAANNKQSAYMSALAFTFFIKELF